LSQWGRRYIDNDTPTQKRFEMAVGFISHPIKLHDDYAAMATESLDPHHYYNTAAGFWDRLQFIATDDSLNEVTDRGSVFGYLPITVQFINAVPRVFMPNKPVINFGNIFAHEIGGLPAEDDTTGISFSPVAEAYHLGSWQGVIVVAPLVWMLLFYVFDLLCGDLRATPWGLLAIALVSHVAPEQGLEGCIYLVSFGSEILIFSALFCQYVAPPAAEFFLGKSKPVLAPLQIEGAHHTPLSPLRETDI
jgi:hypothetical protein